MIKKGVNNLVEMLLKETHNSKEKNIIKMEKFTSENERAKEEIEILKSKIGQLIKDNVKKAAMALRLLINDNLKKKEE